MPLFWTSLRECEHSMSISEVNVEHRLFSALTLPPIAFSPSPTKFLIYSDFHEFIAAARWRVRSWSWTAVTTTLLDEILTFLCAAKGRARSWSWTAVATTLLDVFTAFLCAARGRAQSCSWTAVTTTLLD